MIVRKKRGYEALIEVLLPVVHKLLMDSFPEISSGAAEVLADIAEILSEEDRGTHILTIVLSKAKLQLELAHNNNDVEARVAAIKLLSKLASKFGQELCERFVAPELMSMAEDPNQVVRKVTVQNLVNICEIVSKEYFVKKILGMYRR
jgi:HEAT repeat protein